jgi:glycosyltransferase involved in cell wall biosynthesis
VEPKVSVIIPTYKRSQYLGRAVDSALSQSYPHVEVVVVDDNAEDAKSRGETAALLAPYIEGGRVTLVSNEKNCGPGVSRNNGVAKCSGQYIAFLDDDDIFLENKVLGQLAYMLENELDASFSDTRMHNAEDVLVDYREHSYVKSLDNKSLLENHIMHSLTPTSAYMYKKEVFEALGGFPDQRVGEEYMLMLNTIEAGYKIGYYAKAGVIQYVHGGAQLSVGKRRLAAEKDMYAVKKSYFPRLTPAQRRYVRFRHHCVAAVVSLRSHMLLGMAGHAVAALVSSPLDTFKEISGHLRRMKKYKQHQ